MEYYGNPQTVTQVSADAFLAGNEPAAPQITKVVNGCTVVIHFAPEGNEQVSSVVKDILMQSYKDKLFSK